MTINNQFKNTFIEFHILQSFPVTCLNRDDVGAPKSAVVGGVPRARVSSQAWKRPVRLAMREFGAILGTRTKLISKLVQIECCALGATPEQAKVCGDWLEGAFIKAKTNKKPSKKVKDESEVEMDDGGLDSHDKSDVLIFLSPSEVKELAKVFADHQFEAIADLKESEQKKRAKEVVKILNNKNIDGIDIALFGRMVAQAAELNVEAAASFAHAISTHKVANEIEFFTAVDDMQRQDESGSAHMGSLEFNSATYYRYVSLDIGQLHQTLAGQHILEAIESFIKALYVAVPTARQTTMSGAACWDYAKIFVRKGQRLQVSFDCPVKSHGDGYLSASIEKLNKELAQKEKMSGSLFGKITEMELPMVGIDDVIDQVKSIIQV